MGKSRRNRARSNYRPDPLGKPAKAPSDPQLAALREQKILPVLKDLKSADPKLRALASSAIANIVQDPKCRRLLLREQVVRIVLNETLTDASLVSRAAGWFVLRVLVEEETADLCVHLYRLDVLSAIEHACRAVSSHSLLSFPHTLPISDIVPRYWLLFQIHRRPSAKPPRLNKTPSGPSRALCSAC